MMEIKKKIIFVVGTMAYGGAERVVSILANELCARNFEISIIQLYSEKCTYSINENIENFALYPYNKTGIFRILGTIKNLRSHLIKEEPDLIISFLSNINIYSVVSALRLKIPIIISERNDPNREPSRKILRIIRNISYNFVNSIVFQTRDAKNFFNKSIQKKGIIIHNPIVGEIDKPCFGKRKNQIVTVCRLSKQKNLKLLIDSFIIFHAKHKEYELLIYGDGEEREDLQKYIDRQNIKDNIFFMGFRKDVHKQIKDCSMFVLTSDYEGIPNALLEAMALGIPCISTDCPVGGPREFIQSGVNGLLIPVNNRHKLVEAMEYICNNPLKAKNFGLEASKITKILSADKIVSKWIETINNTLNESRTKNITQPN